MIKSRSVNDKGGAVSSANISRPSGNRCTDIVLGGDLCDPTAPERHNADDIDNSHKQSSGLPPAAFPPRLDPATSPVQIHCLHVRMTASHAARRVLARISDVDRWIGGEAVGIAPDRVDYSSKAARAWLEWRLRDA